MSETASHLALRERLMSGLAIPAHPLALDENGALDERSQRALTRYYLAAGAGGVAVGVHTTQFAIRDPKLGLLGPVLELGAETTRAYEDGGAKAVLVAGVCGETDQAIREATLAREFGYHAALLSPGGLGDWSEEDFLEHARTVAKELPLFGFYLQPAVGGRYFSYSFWRSFLEIPDVVAIKVAPFNRYQTLDVVRALADSGRAHEVALYTGNDDNIVGDLVSRYNFESGDGRARVVFSGGLLGHWACWTLNAVRHLNRCRSARETGNISTDLLTLGHQVTHANAALFDAANGYAGCIAGIHYVLSEQGLIGSTRLLDPSESMSPGQQEEIDRVRRVYPQLADDQFVREKLQEWRG